MTEKSRFALYLLLLTLLISACSTSIVVNSDGSLPDIDPNDEKCATFYNDCTLLAAIQHANLNSKADLITFENVNLIKVKWTLPNLSSGNISIDGGGIVTIQGDAGAACAKANFNGFHIKDSSYNVIQGLTITGFYYGIRIDGLNGTAKENVIGMNPNLDPVASMSNVISGNCNGVFLVGAGAKNNTIAGNFIGTDASGQNAWPNERNGLTISGAKNTFVGDISGYGGSTGFDQSELSAYWPMDENSGNALDAIGGNNLTDVNGVDSKNGILNGARDFERNQVRYFVTADNADLSTGDIDFSISAWFKIESLPGATMQIVSKYDNGSNREYRLFLTSNDNLKFQVYKAGGNVAGAAVVANALTTGVWYHAVAWHDSVNNTVGIAVDGVGAVSSATSGAPGDSSASFRIGSGLISSAHNFDGLIDEVFFWKRVLSPQEIVELYNNGQGMVLAAPSVGGNNVISGNGWNGIEIYSNSATQNHISGNFIGTNSGGTSALGNGRFGISITSGANQNIIGINSAGDGSGNVVSANGGGNGRGGLYLNNVSANVVAGNMIGVDITGMQALGNKAHGIWISSANNNRIGTNGDGVADSAESNVVSGNGVIGFHKGIYVGYNSSHNHIAGNFIGTNFDGSSAIGNMGTGVGLGNGANNNFIGTDGDGSGDAIEGNVISGNGGSGISLSSSFNTIAGNMIGTDASGMQAIGNLGSGINGGGGASNNVIGTNGDGTADALEGNVISGNGSQTYGGSGILFYSGDFNVIAGNLIGTDASGNGALGNWESGVEMDNGQNNIIGTDGDGVGDSEEGNVISANGREGVHIQGGSNNTVAGNMIGSNASGTAALGNGVDSNGHAGVLLNSSTANNVVGTNGDGIGDAIEGNVISGNWWTGVEINDQGSQFNVIAGNLIGTDAAGVNSLGTQGTGIRIEYAPFNHIGTNEDGLSDSLEANVISGNGGDGIHIFIASSNLVAGNFVGTAADGVSPLGNGRHGLHLGASNFPGMQGNTIGGSLAKANVIAFNGWNGILVTGGSHYAVQNPILYNSIHSNDGRGIDLKPGDLYYGITPNDAGDADAGSNDLVNFPELSTALSLNNSVSVGGNILSGLPNASFKIQFFSVPVCDEGNHGEGKVFLGESSEMTDGAGNASFLVSLSSSVTPGEFITATATNSGNTSEFSACVEISAGQNLSGESSSGPEPLKLIVIKPLQNLNCRLACTTQAKIVDTLFEGESYVVNGWDPETMFFAIEGPVYGGTCFAPPQSAGKELMSIFLGEDALPFEELSLEIIDRYNCPTFEAPTPTSEAREEPTPTPTQRSGGGGKNPTPTPTETPTPRGGGGAVPQCSDGIDNDGDGLIDLRDPECRNANDNNEAR